MYQEKNTKNALLLFIGIIFILFLWNPDILLKLYNNIYGKLILILLLIMFTVHTIYFGLALLIIILLVIQWEPLKHKKKSKKPIKKNKSMKNNQKIFISTINVNPVIKETKPMNSKKMIIPKTKTSNVEPFILSSLIKNSHSLFI